MGERAKTVECTDLEDVEVPSERAPTREEMTALLQSVAAAARPGHGSEKVLTQVIEVLRRCPWIAGELRMDLIGDATQTTVHLYTERDGVREPALPPVDFAVPRDELESDTPTTKRPVLPEATRSGERRRITHD